MGDATLAELIAIPLIAAATGYFTNFIAVRMLFRPRREFRFLGLRFQGLIPKRRTEIAHSVGDTVEQHLISHDDIRRVLESPEVDARIRETLNERFDDFIENGLKGLNPMVAMMLNGPIVEKIKSLLMKEIVSAVGPMTEGVMDTLEEQLDFKQMVVDKIENFDLDLFEQIVLRIASRELRAIEFLGAALGLVIGLMTDVLLLL